MIETPLRKIALIGANGMLATAVKKHLPVEYELNGYDLPDFDLTDQRQVFALEQDMPDIIINCAAFTNVDGCEEQPELALRVNGKGPGFLAELAQKIGALLVHISTDFVFDGSKTTPYLEDDQTQPLSVYGKSKLLGEQKIQQSGLEKYFIVRTSWLYGAGGNNFVETMIRLARERSELKIVADQRGTPTWTEDLAQAIFSLLQTDQYGIYHFSNNGDCSWFEFACEIVDQVRASEGLQVKEILPIPTAGYPLPAERPQYSVMSKEKFSALTKCEISDWKQSLKSYLEQRRSS